MPNNSQAWKRHYDELVNQKIVRLQSLERTLGAFLEHYNGVARASRLGRVQISRRDPLRQHSRLGRIVFVTEEPPSSARISALRASFSAFVGMRLLKTLG